MRVFPWKRTFAASLALLTSVLVTAWLGTGCEDGLDDGGCDGTCPQAALSDGEVRQIIAQAVTEAEVLGVKVTIAVTDRIGNVLGVFRMNGARGDTLITDMRGQQGGLEGISGPTALGDLAPLAAISKAGTAAYLSSQGNAFTTRTASQIIQEHFNPGEFNRPGGPLFGVQFSQLVCGDVVTLAGSQGPRPLPLGLAGDPGGVPIFKAVDGEDRKVPVGGIGVEGVPEPIGNEVRPLYRIDPVATDFDDDPEEQIALAGIRGFEPPENRKARVIFVDGKSFRYVDGEGTQFDQPIPFDQLDGSVIAVNPFNPGVIRGGVVLGSPESGIVPTQFAGLPAEILPRHPIRGSSVAGGPTVDEVTTILASALDLTFQTRAQIRRPLDTPARVSIAVVDTAGALLGLLRTPDAPLFGTDVAVQKARTAAFFSAPNAADSLNSAGLGSYVNAVRNFLGDPNALTGNFAFSDRAGGNLSRPFFPDGIDGNPNGPLSQPFPVWSPFNTGLQLDLVLPGLQAALFSGSIRNGCSNVPQLPNGIQIFPGSVPIYRGNTVIGGIGISGDGVDQDDLFAFLGLHNAGQQLGTLGNAPPAIRADQIEVNGSHLRFVNCPVRPFIGSDDQGVCNGL